MGSTAPAEVKVEVKVEVEAVSALASTSTLVSASTSACDALAGHPLAPPAHPYVHAQLGGAAAAPAGSIRSIRVGAPLRGRGLPAARRARRSVRRRPWPVRPLPSTPGSRATRRARGLMRLAAGCWMAGRLVAGNWKLETGCWLLVAGYRNSSAVSFELRASSFWLLSRRGPTACPRALLGRRRVGAGMPEDAAVQRLDLLGGLVPLDGDEVVVRSLHLARRPASATRRAGPFPGSSRQPGQDDFTSACRPPSTPAGAG